MSDNKIFLTQFSEEQLRDWLSSAISEAMGKIKSNEGDIMLCAAEVAALHGVSTQTVQNWTKTGKLKSYTNGGRRVYYKKSEVTETLKELKKYKHANEWADHDQPPAK